MGCNCKGGKARVINNLNSSDHIDLAKGVQTRIILSKDRDAYSEEDKMDIMYAYKELYPNSSGIPNLDNAVDSINIAITNYEHLTRKK